MEIVLNFEKKEMVVKEAAKINELYDRLKKMLGKDLKNWTIVSDVVYQNNDWWYYKPYRTYPWWSEVICGTDDLATWIDYTGGTGEITFGTYCFSDNASMSVSPEVIGGA